MLAQSHRVLSSSTTISQISIYSPELLTAPAAFVQHWRLARHRNCTSMTKHVRLYRVCEHGQYNSAGGMWSATYAKQTRISASNASQASYHSRLTPNPKPSRLKVASIRLNAAGDHLAGQARTGQTLGPTAHKTGSAA